MVSTDRPLCQCLAIAIVRVTAPWVTIGECPSWLLISLSIAFFILGAILGGQNVPYWRQVFHGLGR